MEEFLINTNQIKWKIPWMVVPVPPLSLEKENFKEADVKKSMA